MYIHLIQTSTFYCHRNIISLSIILEEKYIMKCISKAKIDFNIKVKIKKEI